MKLETACREVAEAMQREGEMADRLAQIADIATDWSDDDLTVLQLRARLKAIASLTDEAVRCG